MADMDKGGWIKLNRSIWDNFIWSFDKPQYSLAWIDILLMANYKDKKILFDGKVEVVKQGSFVTSIVKLAERWNMNRRTVKHFLDVLQSDGMITYTSTKRCTTIFVTKYLEYQGFAGSDDIEECTTDYTTDCTTQCTTDYTTDCTQHKKVKKVKEREESKKDLSISKDMDCSTDVQRTIIQAWNGLGLSKVLRIVPNSTRDKLLSKRLKDYGVDHVLGAIEKIRQSEFLNGNNKKGWVITFDWFIRPDNFAKVVGGNYDNNQAPPQTKTTGGRKEMVPDWMKKDREKAFDDSIKKDMEWLKEFDQKQKNASDDP